jgi:hypothetical protein
MTILYRITFVWCFRPVRLREAAYVTLKAESRDLSDVKTVLKGCVNAQPELVNQTQLLKKSSVPTPPHRNCNSSVYAE